MKLNCVNVLEGHVGTLWCVDWSPDGKKLASCGSDCTVRVWEEVKEGTWECTAVLEKIHTRTTRRVEWSPCSRFIAVASFDATATVWEYTDEHKLTAVTTLEGHQNEVKAVTWNWNGGLLATCSRDKSVWIWESDGSGDFDCLSVLNGHSQDVKDVTFVPKQNILVSASYDNSIKVWMEDGDDWECKQTINGHSSTVWSVCCDSSGEFLFSASDDCTVAVWKISQNDGISFNRVYTLSGYHNRPIFSLDVCKLTGRIVSGSGDNVICVFERKGEDEDMSIEVCCREVDAHGPVDVNCVSWNPSVEGFLASCGDEESIRLWKLQ